MLRRLIPLAVAIALLLGCKKKTPDTGGVVAEPPAASASYTIKVREPQKGDKLLVIDTLKDTSTTTIGGKSETKTEQESWEYVETVLETKSGLRKPVRSTREYKTAQATDEKGAMRNLPYSGKTVLIELKGKQYTFSVNGKELPAADAQKLMKEFRHGDKVGKSDMEYLLPKTPVKLNEQWTLSRESLVEWVAQDGITVDPDASSVTAKLTKVYTSEGKQWGTLEVQMKMSVKAVGAGGPPLTGLLSLTQTIDCPIDGSSPETREVTKTTGDVKGTLPQGPLSIKGGDEHSHTVKVVK